MTGVADEFWYNYMRSALLYQGQPTRGNFCRATNSHDESCSVCVGLHGMFALSWPFFKNSDDMRLPNDIWGIFHISESLEYKERARYAFENVSVFRFVSFAKQYSYMQSYRSWGSFSRRFQWCKPLVIVHSYYGGVFLTFLPANLTRTYYVVHVFASKLSN